MPTSSNGIEAAFYREGLFCLFDGESYGYMDESGQEITGFLYDFAYPYSQGLACVRRDEKYGYLDSNGRIAIPFLYDKATPFQEGLAYFEIGDKYGFIDRTGKEQLLLDCDSISSFHEDLAYYSLDGKYGYMDRNGDIVISPIYDDADYFQNGLAKVRKGSYFGVIDKNGREVVAVRYDQVDMDEKLITVQSDKKFGCFNLKGMSVLAIVYDQIHRYGDDIVIWQDSKVGLADIEGNIMLPVSYDSIATLSEKPLAIIEENGLFGVVDYEGNERMPMVYDWIRYNDIKESEILAVSLNEKWGFFNINDFTQTVPFTYEEVGNVYGNRAVACLDGQYGVLDNKGVIIQPFEYEGIRLFEENDCSSVKKDGKWILLDYNGNQISKKAYDSITEFGDGYLCEESSRFGILNRKGEEIQAPIFSYGMDYAYYTENCYITRCVNSGERENCIVIKKEIEKKDTSELLINEITPRIKQYHEFIKDGHMSIKEWENDFGITMDQLEHNKLTYQLWRLGNFDLPVLYVFAQSYSSTPYPLTYSGFYCIEDNQLQELLIGYECGGSIGGNYVNLWYDKMEKLIKLGSTGTYGGFGGNALDADIYDYEKGSLKAPLSFSRVRQSVANYGEELVQNAHLFYDDSNIPYTEDSILQAEIVIAYYVNGEQTTLENYTESFSNRFLAIP